MKVRLLILFFAMALAVSMPCAAEKVDNKNQFHPPQTEAEKTLDKIIMHLDDPAQVITAPLSGAIAKKEKEYVDETCAGKNVEGEECGFSYDVFTCAQDHPDVFLYRTVRSDKDGVILTYTWPEYVEDGTAKDGPLYRMIKVKSGWMLDGIDCGSVGRFNME
jgi:hypothetical protein